jgi:hypothetical protein
MKVEITLAKVERYMEDEAPRMVALVNTVDHLHVAHQVRFWSQLALQYQLTWEADIYSLHHSCCTAF